MKIQKPKGLIAGFAGTDSIESDSLVLQAGEQWTPKHWEINEHTNPGWEIYFQPEGHSLWQCGQEHFELKPGGYYVIAPGVSHRIKEFLTAESHFYFVVLRDTAIWRGNLPNWPKRIAYGANAQNLELPFRGLIRELGLQGPEHTTALWCYSLALTIEISRLFSKQEHREPAFNFHPIVSQACQQFEADLSKSWKLDTLCNLCGVSVPHMIELFRKDLGKTPHQYLLWLRIERAEKLLTTTNRSITDIAHDLGFSSSQHFSTTFKKKRGISPKSLRRSRF